MDTHVVKVCITAFHGLHSIRQIRKFLSEESTKKALEAKAPVHIRDLLKPKAAGGILYDQIYNQRLLQVPKTKCKSFGDRAFAHSGPSLCNALPLELRLISDINCFKGLL